MKKIMIAACLYNEERFLPYFLRHYLQVVAEPKDIILFVDTETTDRTVEIAKAAGCLVYESPLHGLNDYALCAFASKQLKKYRDQSEWIIWVDGDELVYPATGLVEKLDQHRVQGHQIIKSGSGWQMFSEQFPTTKGQVYTEVTRGIIEAPVNKPVIIQPTAEFHWGPGKHQVDRQDLVTVDSSLSMLHFRIMGLDYYLQRNHNNWERVDLANRLAGHGWETSPDQDASNIQAFKNRMVQASQVPL